MLVIDEYAKEAVLETVKTALDNGSFPRLMERLNYLHTYAAGDHQTDPSAFSRCHLYSSREIGLDFRMEHPKWRGGDRKWPAIDKDGQVMWEPWFNGGLVYHDHNGE